MWQITTKHKVVHWHFVIYKHCDRAIKTLNYTPIITHVTLVYITRSDKEKRGSKCVELILIRLVSHRSNYIKTVLINARFLFHFIFNEARCRWETTIFLTTLHSLSYGIRVNIYLNVLFRICMSLITLQATCRFTFNKSGYIFPCRQCVLHTAITWMRI
jgi:hypothetical protein